MLSSGTEQTSCSGYLNELDIIAVCPYPILHHCLKFCDCLIVQEYLSILRDVIASSFRTKTSLSSDSEVRESLDSVVGNTGFFYLVFSYRCHKPLQYWKSAEFSHTSACD